MKWIPDTVGAINKVCRSDVTPPDLNNSLKKDIEKGMNVFVKFFKCTVLSPERLIQLPRRQQYNKGYFFIMFAG